MELSPEQLGQVIEYLKKWKAAECAICEHDDWAVASTVFVLPEYKPLRAAVYSNIQAVFPVIPLTCKTCGNVLLLSAIAAGVVPGAIRSTAG
jgi:hypothetical protein